MSVTKHRFTIEDYHRMAEAGILTEDDRVELIGGEIIRLAPIGSRHAACVERLSRLLNGRALSGPIGGREVLVRTQNPVVLDEDDEPEPDLAVVRMREDFYERGHPRPDDILLVVEVADTSLEHDRNTKLPLYARSGIPEAWLVDLRNDVVEVHAEPRPEGYATLRYVRRGEAIISPSAPELVISAEEVLGRS
jgi:Uma2 family endonuclease